MVFDPTAEEVHRQAGRWFAEGEPAVYEWFREHLHIISQPSMRHYVRAAMLKNAGLDWTEVLPLEIEDPRVTACFRAAGRCQVPDPGSQIAGIYSAGWRTETDLF